MGIIQKVKFCILKNVNIGSKKYKNWIQLNIKVSSTIKRRLI